ncbi:prepilin-type N-terminal cleavage/methylation domain-containing protein [Nocardioides sp. Kera G14]|uniref:prepilin-type N-terminal cleavage/methylation domain-containing protein n=1 Tax=Nocardioides sp. Kera G14 TaxID=2884264 RepID=UPI002AB1F0AA|nr:prepilin-type N-terminal cleavage/methylation domain-containing protein [Nocardioides sp. Kera G14]
MKQIQPLINRLNRKAGAERGFSLIELIIVIVILGILIAIAIPVYNNIQSNARDKALKSAASNGASQAVAAVADGATIVNGDISGTDANGKAYPKLTKLTSDDVTSVTATGGATAGSTDDICVTATSKDGKTAKSGPGC